MHSEYRRIVPGAQKAVLFVHGINATPRFFDEYAAALPADVSVHNLLLPGHGGSVRDFGRHSAAEWESHVRAALDDLRKRHEQVSRRSEKCMAGNPSITISRMEKSSHHIFTPEDKAAIRAALLAMCALAEQEAP